jgi:hypothetical protein
LFQLAGLAANARQGLAKSMKSGSAYNNVAERALRGICWLTWPGAKEGGARF